MQDVKFPKVKVQLVGEDGNAFAIMGRVAKALRRGGVDKVEIDKFYEEAMSGDYNHLLFVVMQYVSIDNDDKDEGDY